MTAVKLVLGSIVSLFALSVILVGAFHMSFSPAKGSNDGVQCVSTGAAQSVTNAQLQAHPKPYHRKYCGSDLKWHYVHGPVRNGHPGVWHPKKAGTGGNVPNVTKNITQTVNPKSGLTSLTSGGSASGG